MLTFTLTLCAAVALLGHLYCQAIAAKERAEEERDQARRDLDVEQNATRVYRDCHRATRDLSEVRQAEACEVKTTSVPSILLAWHND